MKARVSLFVVVALLVAFASVSACADDLIVGGGWAYFDWYAGPGVWATPTFSLSADDTCTVQITDAFLTGDQFEVYVDGILEITTSATPDGLALGASTGDDAWAELAYSRGCFVLNAGKYEIKIKNIQIPTGYPDGGAYIRALDGVVPCVPEPSSVVALVSGLGGVLGLAWRRRS